MQIPFEVISEHLGELWKTANHSEQNTATAFPLPVFYRSGSPFDNNTLYVLDTEELPEVPVCGNNVGIISIGQPPRAYTLRHCYLLILPGEADKTAVYLAVVDLFRKYDCWMDDLQSEMHPYANIQTIIERTYPLVNAPIYMLDSEYKIIGHMEQPGRDNWPNTANVFNGQEIPADWLTNPIADYKTRNGLYRGKAKILSVDYITLCHNIYIDSSFCGLVALAHEVGIPFKTRDRFILSSLAAILSANYSSYVATQPFVMKSIQTVLYDAVVANSVDKRTLTTYAGLLGANINDRYVCLAMQFDMTCPLRLPARYICAQVHSQIQGAICLLTDSRFAVFINMDIFGGCIRIAIEKLSHILEAGHFLVGVSNEFYDLTRARDFYLQSCSAIEMGIPEDRKTGCHYHIFEFQKCAVQYIIRRGITEMPVDVICLEGVKMMCKIDETTGTEYCKTLSVYFKNKMNAVQSSKELFLHRNSFLQRLKRIKQILDVDMDDYQLRLYIMLSLELCGYSALPDSIKRD